MSSVEDTIELQPQRLQFQKYFCGQCKFYFFKESKQGWKMDDTTPSLPKHDHQYKLKSSAGRSLKRTSQEVEILI